MKPSVVYQFQTHEAQELGFTTVRSPDDDTEIGYAHCSVLDRTGRTKPEFRRARSYLAAAMTLVLGEIMLPPPPGA